MRIDKPICMYGEANCRKHFDGNCMVENDFDYICPIRKTINKVLEIIDQYTHTTFLPDGSVIDAIEDVEGLRDAIEDLKGGEHG